MRIDGREEKSYEAVLWAKVLWAGLWHERKEKKKKNKAETSTENPATMSTETIIRKKQVEKSIPWVEMKNQVF